MVKTDTFRSLIEREAETASMATTFISAAKVVGPDTLEAFARQIARLHRPIRFDWARKFGLGAEPPAAQLQPPAAPTPARGTPDKLSTSKLAAKLGIKGTGVLLTRLVDAGYLVTQGDEHMLTPQGHACGAEHVAKSRFGPYFLWPADLAV